MQGAPTPPPRNPPVPGPRKPAASVAAESTALVTVDARQQAEAVADARALGLKLLEMATYINRENEAELTAARESLKRSQGARTPRGERSGTWYPIPALRQGSRTPRASLPPLEHTSSSSVDDGSEDPGGDADLAGPLTNALVAVVAEEDDTETRFSNELRQLSLAKLIRDEDERAVYEEREALKRSRSKTPRATKSKTDIPTRPRRPSHISPRPQMPSPQAHSSPKRGGGGDSYSDDDDVDHAVRQQIAAEILAASAEASVRRLVERSVGSVFERWDELSTVVTTTMVVRVGRDRLLQGGWLFPSVWLLLLFVSSSLTVPK